MNPPTSKAEKQYKDNSFHNWGTEATPNEKDQLEVWDNVLKKKSYFHDDGFEIGDVDFERFKELKADAVNANKYPNLYRWYKTVEKHAAKKQ